MKFEEIKNTGWAPFARAEIHISLRKHVARFVLLVPDRGSSELSMDFQLSENEADVEHVGRELISAAIQKGLLTASSTVVLVDLDSATVN